MKTTMSEVVDLALTQAIERYMEMQPEAACDAIIAEWPEQLSVLLVEFLFRSTCGGCEGIQEFVHIPRSTGDTSCIVPLCSCDFSDL